MDLLAPHAGQVAARSATTNAIDLGEIVGTQKTKEEDG